jgi:riboflavin synthase
MFTGLVQAIGEVARVEPQGAGLSLWVRPREWEHQAEVGESICVSGCCLTVAEVGADGWRFDAIPETLSKTTLGESQGRGGGGAGRRVNLERSLRAMDLMGGHIVQGHVDGVGVVERVLREGGEHRVRVRVPRELGEYLVPKGSVAVDGVSLTVALAEEEWFEVALIPTTLELTTLSELREGSRVNLEMDQVAKTIVEYMKKLTTKAQRHQGEE